MLNFVTFFLSRYIYQVNNFREFLNIILSSACIYTQLYHNLCYCSSAKCRFFVFFRVIFLIQAFVMYFHELKFHNNKFVKLSNLFSFMSKRYFKHRWRKHLLEIPLYMISNYPKWSSQRDKKKTKHKSILRVHILQRILFFFINNVSNTYHNMGSFINSVDFF